MDIKLNARLSAYSKVDSLRPIQTVTQPQIDSLFVEVTDPSAVTKSEIDTLFTNMSEPQSVTKSEIDTLFLTYKEPESVTKSEIDTMFNSSETDVIKTVSFKEIDSLFK